MRAIHSEDCLRHRPGQEFHRGVAVPSFESAARAEGVLAALRASALGPVEPAHVAVTDAELHAVHTPAFVAFLRTAHAEWVGAGRAGDALPTVWPVRGAREDRVPACLDGRLSYYSCDMATPITAGTWIAARAAVDVAVSGVARLVDDGEHAAFGLCRPPGHHAGPDVYGGYCYLNNAAIAAQALRDRGAERVAILDVDYHHGNGTQRVFEARDDVFFASIHADPATDYPYFGGYADEVGVGAGVGCTANFPLPRGTRWPEYAGALDSACRAIDAFGAEVVVVSLGVDSYAHDPIAAFGLEAEDFGRLGARIAGLGQPTLFLLEGGYAVADIGRNVCNVLAGFTR